MSNRDNQQRYGNSASDPPDRQAGVDKVEDRQRRTIRLLGGSAGVGLAASVLYAAQFGLSRFPSVLGSALIVAFGSAMSGGLLGFLFALPRGRRGEPLAPAHPPVQSQAAATGSSVQSDTEREAVTRPNTNLDDISDWLTKILVGVSLIQLGSIGRALGRLSAAVAPALGGVESSPAFGLALMVTFALTGFMLGYLWTRFYIPVAFERAESDVKAELRALREQAAQAKENVEELAARSGAVVEDAATEVRQQVRQTLEQLGRQPGEAPGEKAARDQARALAEQYEKVRRTMSSGPARTFEMSRIVSRARTSVDELPFSPDEICDLFREGEGGRIVSLGLIAGKPDPSLVDLVREAISRPASAFEQYQALQAAKALVGHSGLSQPDRHSLRAAIEDQMRPGANRYITPGTDRFALASDSLARL